MHCLSQPVSSIHHLLINFGNWKEKLIWSLNCPLRQVIPALCDFLTNYLFIYKFKSDTSAFIYESGSIIAYLFQHMQPPVSVHMQALKPNLWCHKSTASENPKLTTFGNAGRILEGDTQFKKEDQQEPTSFTLVPTLFHGLVKSNQQMVDPKQRLNTQSQLTITAEILWFK